MRRLCCVLSVMVLAVVLPPILRSPEAEAFNPGDYPAPVEILAPAGAVSVTYGVLSTPVIGTGLLAAAGGTVAAVGVAAALGGYVTGRYALGPATCKNETLGGVVDFIMPGTGGAEVCNPYSPPEWTSPDFGWSYSGGKAVLSWEALNWPDVPPSRVVGALVTSGSAWRELIDVSVSDGTGCFIGKTTDETLGGWYSAGGCPTTGDTSGTGSMYSQAFVKVSSNGPFRPEDRIAVMPAQQGSFIQYSGGSYHGKVLYSGVDTPVGGWAPAPDFVRERGNLVGYKVTADCVPVGSPLGTPTVRTVTGDFAFEGTSSAAVPAVPCLEAEIARRTEIQKIGPNRSGAVVNIGPVVAADLDVSVDYVPCLVVTSDCGDIVHVPETQTVPEHCTWGAFTIPISDCDPAASARVGTITPGEAWTPPAAPELEPHDPSTEDHSIPDTAAPTAPVLPPLIGDGGGRFGTCVATMTDGSSNNITYNPATWVRAILYWVWAPIFCAFWWLIVPANGWGSIWDRIKAIWLTSAALAGLRALVEDLDFEGSCLPVDLRSTFSDDEVFEFDAGMCGNLYVAGVWTFLLGAAAISMIQSVVESVVTLQKSRKSQMGAS